MDFNEKLSLILEATEKLYKKIVIKLKMAIFLCKRLKYKKEF